MADVSIREGDRLPVLDRQFLQDGTAVDLAGSTVVFNLWATASGTQVITNGACTLVDAANGDVRYSWTSTDATLAAGSYIGSFTATFGDGRKLTAPNNDMITVEIYSNQGATWSYSGNPSTRVLDAIRFLIGDTDSTEQLLSDQEIVWVNQQAQNGTTGADAIYDAAHRCCHAIAAKFAREADKQIGDLQVAMSQRAEAYRKLAADLKVHALREGNTPIPYAGGITISDKQVDQDNTDIFRGYFVTGQFQDFRDGGRTNTQQGIEYFGPGANR